ncbi:transglycosylase family protein [Actinacidiphila sp. ITFR-21]|uniref:transglycosylase family protein n=1 Tax=Actinacidiphila sp. ITFR-21 TaxID=3075199 RepID=UPI00288C2780|nr:transglycosylase family protein [Streptomyces sp. ITFR-21]WNI15832.1 transglycosylase family protein [Streptomyces sp. ITFR-21]
MLSSGNGRHRRPRPTPAAVVTMATAAATGAGIALPLFGAATAQAADQTTWDRVAFCETGGSWHANSGNGFYGGLAITQDTWDLYGGAAYAERPDLASEADQIAVAERMLTELGPNAWPGCEEGTGLLQDPATPDPGSSPSPQPAPAQPGEHPPATTPPTPPSGAATDPATPPVAPTAPATPGAPSTAAPGDPGDGGTGPSAPPVTPAVPAAPTAPAGTTPPPGLPDPGGAATLAPTDPTGALPTAPDAGSGAGRHAKPYSPTDEELAARDQATRTQVFSVTDTDSAAPSGPASTDTANKGEDPGTSPAGRYTVGAGDSLSGIATAQHVDGGWRQLYQANRQSIGEDPNLIKPGQILNLG